LFLTSGGTDFCQGLSVIVDDVNGMLPLNPTKQDFAFGEQVHGDVHRNNMVAWVGAVTKMYWAYHYEVTYGAKKELLSKQIKALVNYVKRWTKDDGSMPLQPSISDCTFSTIKGMSWKLFKKREGPTALQVKNKRILQLVPGNDTLIKFPRVDVAPAERRAKASFVSEATEDIAVIPAPPTTGAKKRKKSFDESQQSQSAQKRPAKASAMSENSKVFVSSSQQYSAATYPKTSTAIDLVAQDEYMNECCDDPPSTVPQQRERLPIKGSKEMQLVQKQPVKASTMPDSSIVSMSPEQCSSATYPMTNTAIDLVAQDEYANERIRGDRYKEKARVYRTQRDEYAQRVAELSVQVSKLQKQVKSLKGDRATAANMASPKNDKTLIRENSV
jgi:hypothetical protein